jgi:hypothetical protein
VTFSDAITVLGLPPLCGIYWGSIAFLRGLLQGRSITDALRRAEVATAFVTALAALLAPAALSTILICIYA